MTHVFKVGPILTRTSYYSAERAAISPAERLALTLRYLATGNSQVTAVLTMYIYIFYLSVTSFDVQVSLSFNFRVGRYTVCGILTETCAALWSALKPEYVTPPSTKMVGQMLADSSIKFGIFQIV